ncbi:MAG: hypothetical protein A2868_01615 [Candidatus Levybacteria bacterium RIFCSPHIGHO2_01_FULL_40_15b]|nr:MAG: hypothetical protein A2868_01615 [Candidatus Levybacteria bacterium RIFCSPHIGHO2_01_FULL_40_15b]
MKTLSLFIDESGDVNPKVSRSEVYILAGCMTDEYSRERLKIEADQIKFKLWSRTDIIFHSREVGRKEGDFKILKDPKIYKEFKKDLFNFLNKNSYQIFFVLVDKKKALSQNWDDRKVYTETSAAIVKNFILSLVAQGNVKGRLVIEAATSLKDFYFHKAASYFLSAGLPELGINYQTVQDVLTEISFVTKKNHDIEEQISDLLAFGAKLKFLGKKQVSMNEYEKRLVKVASAKIFKMDPNTGARKKKYYSEIDSFKILP